VLWSISPLLLLQFPLAPCALRLPFIATAHTRKAFLHAHNCSVDQVDRVNRNDGPEPPSTVIEYTGSNNAAQGPIQHIPHVFGQAGSIQIFTGRAQGTVLVVAWAANSVKVEFNKQGWESQKEVWFQRAWSLEHLVEDEKEDVDCG